MAFYNCFLLVCFQGIDNDLSGLCASIDMVITQDNGQDRAVVFQTMGEDREGVGARVALDSSVARGCSARIGRGVIGVGCVIRGTAWGIKKAWGQFLATLEGGNGHCCLALRWREERSGWSMVLMRSMADADSSTRCMCVFPATWAE